MLVLSQLCSRLNRPIFLEMLQIMLGRCKIEPLGINEGCTRFWLWQIRNPAIFLEIWPRTILITVTRTKNTKFIAIPQILSKTGKQWRNKGSTELYCLFVADGSIAETISFIRRIVLWSKNWNSQIRYNTKINVAVLALLYKLDARPTSQSKHCSQLKQNNQQQYLCQNMRQSAGWFKWLRHVTLQYRGQRVNWKSRNV